MNPEEAIKIIDSVLANVTATRFDHVKILEAVEVLKKAITIEKTEKKP